MALSGVSSVLFLVSRARLSRRRDGRDRHCAFGEGYAVARWATGGYLWGGGVNWGENNLVVNRPVNVNNVGTTCNRAARVEQRQEREARRNERQAGRGERRPSVKRDAVNVRLNAVMARWAIAAIESCDRRIRCATLDHRYLHLLARCHLCAKLSKGP